MRTLFLMALLSTTALLAAAGGQFVGYFQSWSEKWSDKGSDLTLAHLAEYVNVVDIAFMSPDGNYWGGYDISQTGIDFSVDGKVLKQAIDLLKFKNPNTKVLISVGGADATNWDNLNVDAIKKFVNDFDLDGVDIDFEPSNPGCTSYDDGTVYCDTDDQFKDIVSRLRKAIPSPKVLTIAAWSTGAYGHGDYRWAEPQDEWSGMSVNLLQSDEGKSLDWITIMGYDVGTDYNPKQAFDAYKSIYGGKISLGVEIPPEAWGDHKLKISELKDLTSYVHSHGGAGIMLWSLQQQPNGDVWDDNPNPEMVAQNVCDILGLGDCSQPLGC